MRNLLSSCLIAAALSGGSAMASDFPIEEIIAAENSTKNSVVTDDGAAAIVDKHGNVLDLFETEAEALAVFDQRQPLPRRRPGPRPVPRRGPRPIPRPAPLAICRADLNGHRFSASSRSRGAAYDAVIRQCNQYYRLSSCRRATHCR